MSFIVLIELGKLGDLRYISITKSTKIFSIFQHFGIQTVIHDSRPSFITTYHLFIVSISYVIHNLMILHNVLSHSLIYFMQCINFIFNENFVTILF